ncbi:uncharacterized protein LOC142323672 isoform X2 [Lycorma delicatula]|uniref:uncharacterized protein LOC142323672 isoform X2 n=1 Tax=Lycorma delicatula TaxID=130591 RepID=UPI003F5156EB
MSANREIRVLRFVLWLLFILTFSHFSSGVSCKIGVPFECGKNETCKEAISQPGLGFCDCLRHFVRTDGTCILSHSTAATTPTVGPDSNQNSNVRTNDFTVALWLIVPCIIVAFVGGLVYIGQRYMWMERLYRLRVRHYDTVLVNNQGDDDDDDPPIAWANKNCVIIFLLKL